jgi:adenylate cyclase class IV
MAYEIPADSIEGAPGVEVDIRDLTDAYPIEYEIKVFPEDKEKFISRIEALGGVLKQERHLLKDIRLVPASGLTGNENEAPAPAVPSEAFVAATVVEGTDDAAKLSQALQFMGYAVAEAEAGWNITPPEGPLPPMLVRFRYMNGKCILTVKDQRPKQEGPEEVYGKDMDKRRETGSIKLSDAKTLQEALQLAGFSVKSDETKYRTAYEFPKMNGMEVVMDEPVTFQGKNIENEELWWSEVEGPDEKSVREMVTEKLGYDWGQTAAVSSRRAVELLRAKREDSKKEQGT